MFSPVLNQHCFKVDYLNCAKNLTQNLTQVHFSLMATLFKSDIFQVFPLVIDEPNSVQPSLNLGR